MKEQLQENKTSIAKWIFVGFDLLTVATVFMLLPRHFWGFYPIYFYLVFYRANISVMMLRNDKKSIWGGLFLIILTCAFFVVSTQMGIVRLQWYSDTIFLRYFENRSLEKLLSLFLVIWFIFTPFIYSMGCVLSTKNTNDARWFDIFALTYFKRTPWGDQIISLFCLLVTLFVAEIIGLYGQTILGSLWCVPLSMAGLWMLTRVLKIHWRENRHKLWIFGGYFLLLTAFWASQYLYSEKRIVIALSYVLGTALSYYTVSKCTQSKVFGKIIKTALIVIVTFLILPILTLGYNIFSSMDYVRIGGFRNKAMTEHYSEYADNAWQVRMRHFKRQSFYVTRGVYYIKDKDGNIGLRDRRNVIIPVEFEAIEDCMMPYFNVKKDGLWGIYDISGEYMYRNYYWVEEDTKSGIRIPCQFTSIVPDFKDSHYIIVADSKGNKGVLNLCETKGTGYYVEDNDDVLISQSDETLVVPVRFEKIMYVRNEQYDYFIASKKVDGRELFWLYINTGKEITGNCISIIPISLENIQVTDIDGNTRNLLENTE